MEKIKLASTYGVFLQDGRLTDIHKYKINSKELLRKLNEIAKEKVNDKVQSNRKSKL